MLKSGIIAICGKPNVGKSTLINAIANKEVAITSPRPQTTRNQINYLYQTKGLCIAFIDTPGFHFAHNKLDVYINQQITLAYKQAKIIFFIADPTKDINEEDLEIISNLKKIQDKEIFVLVNKVDLVNQKKLDEFTTKLHSLLEIKHLLYISALRKSNIDALFQAINPYLDEGKISLTNTDHDDFLISEIIRQQIIFNSFQEIPYATAVVIKHKKYDQKTNVFEIYADIIVEKSSQKPIIIGKNGQKIATIRINSIKKLKTIYDCQVQLHLYVVVADDWRNNDQYLKEIGYQ